MEDDWTTYLRTLESHSQSVKSVAFSYDGKHLASASDDRTVKIWETASGACLQTIRGYGYGVSLAAFSHNSRHLVSACKNTVRVWDISIGKCLYTHKIHHQSRVISFSPSIQYFASTSRGVCTITIWDITTGASLQTLVGHQGRLDQLPLHTIVNISRQRQLIGLLKSGMLLLVYAFKRFDALIGSLH